jgi:hypothetical protein
MNCKSLLSLCHLAIDHTIQRVGMMRGKVGMNVICPATNDKLERSGRIDTMYHQWCSRRHRKFLHWTGIGHPETRHFKLTLATLRAFPSPHERQEGNDTRYVQNFAGARRSGSTVGALDARSVFSRRTKLLIGWQHLHLRW